MTDVTNDMRREHLAKQTPGRHMINMKGAVASDCFVIDKNKFVLADEKNDLFQVVQFSWIDDQDSCTTFFSKEEIRVLAKVAGVI